MLFQERVRFSIFSNSKDFKSVPSVCWMHSLHSHTTCSSQWFTISHQVQRTEVLLFLLMLSGSPDHQKPLLQGKFNMYKWKQLQEETMRDYSKTFCLAAKILILSFRNPPSAFPSGWFWIWDLHLATSPKVLLTNRLLAEMRSTFLPAANATFYRNSTLNTESLSVEPTQKKE